MAILKDTDIAGDLNITGTANFNGNAVFNGTTTFKGSNNLKGVYTTTVINASSLDVNTWYPVVMYVNPYLRTYIDVRSTYGLSSTGSVSWSTHGSGGFVVHKSWSVIGSGWGTSNIDRLIYESKYNWCDSDPVRGINQLTNGSIEYVYVRGGGIYSFSCTEGVVPSLQTGTYTNNSQSVSPTTTAPSTFMPYYGAISVSSITIA